MKVEVVAAAAEEVERKGVEAAMVERMAKG